MATQAHCAFCFETLAAHFESRKRLRLADVEALWDEYTAEDDEEDAEMTDAEVTTTKAKPAAISRLLNSDSRSRNTRSAASSSSSLPSARSGVSSSTDSTSEHSSGVTTPASSRSSLLSPGGKRAREEHPLFVTWNTHSSRSGHKSLRGCIGTFEPLELETGLATYALTSALEDVRFSPMTATELPRLSNHVTLLTNFSEPTRDPLDWTLGTHGIRISFIHHGRKLGATYLPDVAKEQGWTQDETLVSLMRKAGWNGSSSSWAKAWKDGRGELVRYEGKQVGIEYAEWRRFRNWIDQRVAGR